MLKIKALFLTAIILVCSDIYSQNEVLGIYSGAVISMNGDATNHAFLIVNPATADPRNIFRNGSTTSHIENINQNGFNQVQWNIGNVASGAFAFPFGTTAVTDLPITVTIGGASGSAATSLSLGTYNSATTSNLPAPTTPTAVIFDSRFGNDLVNDVVHRWYSIWVNGTAPTISQTVVKYTAAEITKTMTIMAQQWVPNDGSGAAGWNLPGVNSAAASSGVAGSFTITAGPTYNAATTTGAWLLSNSSVPLPVNLTDFSAHCSKGKTLVKWITSSESSNNYFTVQRSLDGKEYVDIGTVQGAGSSSTQHKYAYIDNNAPEGISYYRLQQTDFDGISKKFKPISSNCDKSVSDGGLTIYPNPALNGQNIVVEMNGYLPETEVPVSLYDAVGKLIFQRLVVTDTNGSAFFQVDPANVLAAGIYTILSSSDTQTYTQKLMVNR